MSTRIAILLPGFFYLGSVLANGSAPPIPVPTPTPTSTPTNPTTCSIPAAPRDCLHFEASVCQSDLLSELEGFGRETTGGKDGPIYRVTSLDDNVSNPQPGTLRYALAQPGKLWIVFAKSGTITIKDRMPFTSDKTVDGRGASVTIKGDKVDFSRVTNDILNDVTVTEAVPSVDGSEGHDNISIAKESSRIWIHHVTTSKSGDGLLDITTGATDITVSWTKLMDKPTKAMLLSLGDDYKTGRITLHHNHWYKGDDRMPKVDGYQVHVYNNYYNLSHKGIDITCYHGCQILVENNVWNPDSSNENKMDVTTSGDREGFGRASGNLLKKGVSLAVHKPEKVFTPPYPDTMEAATDDLACRIEKYAGPRAP